MCHSPPVSALSKAPFQPLQTCLGVLPATLFSYHLVAPRKMVCWLPGSSRAVQHCANAQCNGRCDSRAREGRWMAGEDAVGRRLQSDGSGGQGQGRGVCDDGSYEMCSSSSGSWCLPLGIYYMYCLESMWVHGQTCQLLVLWPLEVTCNSGPQFIRLKAGGKNLFSGTFWEFSENSLVPIRKQVFCTWTLHITEILLHRCGIPSLPSRILREIRPKVLNYCTNRTNAQGGSSDSCVLIFTREGLQPNRWLE